MFRLKVIARKYHRQIALVSFPALLVMIASGVVLSLSPFSSTLQPPMAKGTSEGFSLTASQILEVAQTVDDGEIRNWSDIAQIDVRPHAGILRVRSKNHYEIQIDGHTGQILSRSFRPKTWIVKIHDGSFFGDWAHRLLFPVTGLLALLLSITGLLITPLFRGSKRNPVDHG